MFQSEDHVEILGLQKATRFNGEMGIIQSYFESKDRYEVNLIGWQKLLSVRPQNLKKINIQESVLFLLKMAAEKDRVGLFNQYAFSPLRPNPPISSVLSKKIFDEAHQSGLFAGCSTVYSFLKYVISSSTRPFMADDIERKKIKTIFTGFLDHPRNVALLMEIDLQNGFKFGGALPPADSHSVVIFKLNGAFLLLQSFNYAFSFEDWMKTAQWLPKDGMKDILENVDVLLNSCNDEKIKIAGQIVFKRQVIAEKKTLPRYETELFKIVEFQGDDLFKSLRKVVEEMIKILH